MASKTIYDDLVKRVQQIFHLPPTETKSMSNNIQSDSINFYNNNHHFECNPQQHHKVLDNSRNALEKKYQPYASSSSHVNTHGLNASEAFMANEYNANYAINQPSDYGCNQGAINQNQSNDRSKLSNELSDSDLNAMKSIKVTVGIDEDLKMILEMDPSIVDLGGTPTYGDVDDRNFSRLPPLTGG